MLSSYHKSACFCHNIVIGMQHDTLFASTLSVLNQDIGYKRNFGVHKCEKNVNQNESVVGTI